MKKIIFSYKGKAKDLVKEIKKQLPKEKSKPNEEVSKAVAEKFLRYLNGGI